MIFVLEQLRGDRWEPIDSVEAGTEEDAARLFSERGSQRVEATTTPNADTGEFFPVCIRRLGRTALAYTVDEFGITGSPIRVELTDDIVDMDIPVDTDQGGKQQ